MSGDHRGRCSALGTMVADLSFSIDLVGGGEDGVTPGTRKERLTLTGGMISG